MHRPGCTKHSMTEQHRQLMIVAGEASGDEHAAALFRELKSRQPGIEGYGLAGDELIAAGVEAVGHASSIAVVGIVEAFKVLRVARTLYRRLLAEVERRGTRAALLVDSPGFNLRLAKALHRRGVKVIYYISPQLWAWRAGRVETIRECVDEVLVLFDFEVDWYRQRGVRAIHVGHPLVDSVPTIDNAWDRVPPGEDPAEVKITFMPGSRGSEIDRLLPEMVGAAAELADGLPTGADLRLRVIRARNVASDRLERPFVEAGVEVEVVTENRYRAIADSHLVICASGTATLEVGLLGTPMIVVYRLQALTHRLAEYVVQTPHVSLVNLVLDDVVVPELLQNDARAGAIAEEALDLLGDRRRIGTMRTQLAELRAALGESGASARAAAEVERVLAAVPAAVAGVADS